YCQYQMPAAPPATTSRNKTKVMNFLIVDSPKCFNTPSKLPKSLNPSLAETSGVSEHRRRAYARDGRAKGAGCDAEPSGRPDSSRPAHRRSAFHGRPAHGAPAAGPPP